MYFFAAYLYLCLDSCCRKNLTMLSRALKAAPGGSQPVLSQPALQMHTIMQATRSTSITQANIIRGEHSSSASPVGSFCEEQIFDSSSSSPPKGSATVTSAHQTCENQICQDQMFEAEDMDEPDGLAALRATMPSPFIAQPPAAENSVRHHFPIIGG